MHLQIITLKKKKFYFKEELAKNLKKVKKLWPVLKSLGLSSNKASKSRTSLKKDEFNTIQQNTKYSSI